MSEQQMTEQQQIEKLRELIKDIEIAMLTTEEDDGTLRSRPMGTQNDDSFNGELWFFTYGNSHKVDEVKGHAEVCVTYSAPDKQRYVSMSGRASVSRDRKKMEELWSPILKAWFPKGLDEPDIALLNVKVSKAEYWDSPSSPVAHAFGLAKSLLTGETYQPGENEKVNL